MPYIFASVRGWLIGSSRINSRKAHHTSVPGWLITFALSGNENSVSLRVQGKLGLLHSLIAEHALGVDQFLSSLVHALVSSVALQNMGLDRIDQFHIEDMDHFGSNLPVFDREEDLHAAVQVSGHPVCARGIHFGSSAVLKIEDAAVLQEIAHDGTHMNIFADTGYADLEAADAAHDEVDPDARGTGLIEGSHDIGVAQRVHLGFDQGVFTTDHLLDVTEDHEGRICNVEEWGALVAEFEKEPILINVQNPLPVISPTEKYDYSTFTGWSFPIGCPTDFDTLVFTIKNRSQEDYLENVRCFITEVDRSGVILIDEVMRDAHIAPGEWKRIEFHFSRLIDNAEGNELYVGFSCDQYIAFMGGSTGIVLRPPEYGVVCYNSGTPSIDNMMVKPSRWTPLYDPGQDNTSKIDILMAKQATRYGLGSIKEPITDLIHEVTGDQIDAAIYEKASVALPPRVILPDVFHAVVGDTLQLFYRGLVEHPYPYFYNIEFRCDIGKNTPRYYEVTPTAEQAGDHTLTVRVRDHLDNILAEATTVLRVHAVGQAPSLRKNVLCVGDSLTGSGTWCKEALRRLTETGGTPVGLGLSNIRFIGTKRNGECGYEGYGGWTWASYLSAPTATKLGMWVYCSHDKDSTDQHSLWEDASGNIWSMETIEASRIKFTRYQDHTAPMPLGAGTLHHYQNATHTADIDYDETVYAEGNPFWDSDEGQVNFRTYCERNGFDRVDYMVTLLSWNGMAASHYSSSDTLIANHVANAKRLIRILHEQYPNAKVKMMGIQLPSVNGGCGHSYGANSQYSNWYADEIIKMVTSSEEHMKNWNKDPEKLAEV